MADPVQPVPVVAKGVIDPFHEVVDNHHFLISESLDLFVPLPNLGGSVHNFAGVEGFQITKFYVLLTIAALLVMGVMLWLGRRMKDGDTPRGPLWNALEGLLFFVRDKIARAGMGHDGDPYVPFLTALFMLVLITNLLGMIPFMGSATASIAVTLPLAFIAFCVIHVSGVKSLGAAGYAKSFKPHFHLEGGLVMKIFGFALSWGMFVLEVMTAFIRFFVLAIRLFANMLAGHTVLFMILFFIQLVARPLEHGGGYLHPMELPDWLYYPVMLFSVLTTAALSMLEIFIAGLQAFIFTLLTAIFIGLAKHPAH